MSDTLQKLKEIIISKLKLDNELNDLKDETQLFGPEGLGLDSIDVLELVVSIKKEFGVEIADRETAEKVFTSIGAIVQFIEENK